MNKGTYQAVLISVLIHTIIIMVLITTSAPKKQIIEVKTKPPKIKSYIYNAPKKTKSEAKKTAETKTVKEAKVIKTTPPEVAKTSVKNKDSQKKDPTTSVQAKENKKLPKNPNKKQDMNKQTAPKLSALTQLNNLRSKINANISSIRPFELSQPTSGSIIDGEPAMVPHSEVPLTPMQQKEKNTTRYADGLAIIKNENGTCTIEQDLSSVGIEGVTARQGFSCGEDPDKRHFREHMKNVLKKLGK